MICKFRMSCLPQTMWATSKTNWGQNSGAKSRKRSELSCTPKLKERSLIKSGNKLSLKSLRRLLKESLMKYLRGSKCRWSKRSKHNYIRRFRRFKPRFTKRKEISLSIRNLNSKESSKSSNQAINQRSKGTMRSSNKRRMKFLSSKINRSPTKRWFKDSTSRWTSSMTRGW